MADNDAPEVATSASVLRRLPPAIWALGVVSLLMDVSSEMIQALLPVYLVTVLGASMADIGMIEGIAEGTASITKVFSGGLSDWLGKRMALAAVGYGLAAVAKLIFPIAPNVVWIIAARFLDRVGKGIREAPRDALVADIAPVHLRGASFGLRQALDTVGAFVGPLLGIGLMWWTSGSFISVFWVAVLPAILAFCVLVLAVGEPPHLMKVKTALGAAHLAEFVQLPAALWWVVGIATVFNMARFSEAFLVLRAQGLGLPVTLAPAVFVLMNTVYALTAYPAGVLADRIDRATILGIALGLLIAADTILALASGLAWITGGVVLWGLHLGLSQGLLSALIADAAPEELRGTAYGFLNLCIGFAVLAASVTAGLLWDFGGPMLTFLVGSGFAILALAGLIIVRRHISDRRLAVRADTSDCP